VKEEPGENAHLRFGSMRFHKTVGNSQSSFSLRADRLIAEREVDGGAKVHFLSVIGRDAQIAAAGAILSGTPFIFYGRSWSSSYERQHGQRCPVLSAFYSAFEQEEAPPSFGGGVGGVWPNCHLGIER